MAWSSSKHHREREFLDPLPVGLIWGIGPVTRERLATRGILTIGQLATSPDGALRALLGKALGTKAAALAANDDPRRVRPTRRAGSVGAQSAFGRRDTSPELVRSVLSHLADRIAGRLRAKQRAGRTITARVRFADMRSLTRSHTTVHPISTTLTLTEVAEHLVMSAIASRPDQSQISLLAISVSNLVDQPAVQLRLPLEPDISADEPGGGRGAARWAVDRSIDAVRERFGRSAVGYGSLMFERTRTVPDEFRELAERSV